MSKKRTSPFMIQSRKTEVRFVTDDPKKMLGKWVARRAFHNWTEEMKNTETGEIENIERSEVLLERGTYIDSEQLSSISFMLQSGTLKEVEVSNQNRQGELLQNSALYPYKAVAKIDDKRKTFLLYATSVANALIILIDYIELNCKGGFEIKEVKEMDYCVIIIDNLKSAEARRYELDKAYLAGEISTEDFAIATADKIMQGNPDFEEVKEEEKQSKKFYEIGAHVVMTSENDGGSEHDHTFRQCLQFARICSSKNI